MPARLATEPVPAQSPIGTQVALCGALRGTATVCDGGLWKRS